MILWPLTVPRREVNEFCEKVLAQLAGISQIGQQRSACPPALARRSLRTEVTAEMLLASADSAMYQAKSAGKGTYAICEL